MITKMVQDHPGLEVAAVVDYFPKTAVAAAKRLGIPVVISTDAHSIGGMEVMRHGVQQAQRGGLTATDVANAQPWESFRKLLRHALE